MSGLARVLVAVGAVVSGSDLTDAAILEELRALGVTVEIGHDARERVERRGRAVVAGRRRDNVECERRARRARRLDVARPGPR